MFINFKEDGIMTEGYCVKCKEKTEMADAKETTMKNGRSAMKGKCPKCGTGMFKILGLASKDSKPAKKKK